MSEFQQDLENWGADVIFGRAKGPAADLARLVFRVFSWLFGLIARVRVWLFRVGFRSQANLGVKVISVGNLTMGGTGKTPVVEFLCRALLEKGRRPAILSRGYKSKAFPECQKWCGEEESEPGEWPKLVSDGKKVLLNVQYAGDEPFMLAKNLSSGVGVVVDRDRVKGGEFAVEKLGADTLVLDDGMQYLKLRHGTNIVLVDAKQPFGTEFLIPRGTLREPPSHLRRANYIIATRCEEPLKEEQITRLQRYNRTAPIIQTRHAPQYLEGVFDSSKRLELSALKGAYIAAISGIAIPDSFLSSLKSLGAEIVFDKAFGDHQVFPQKKVDAFFDRALRRDVNFVVTTEKDAVRFPKPKDQIIPLYFLRIEVEIIEGHEEWALCLEQLTNPPQLSRAQWWDQRLAISS